MAVLLPNGKQQYFDNNGNLLAGGKVYTYIAGTTTPKNTYTTAAATVPNANPVVLDSRGEASIFWDGAYKIVIKDSAGNTIWTQDNVDTSVDITKLLYNGVALSTILLSSSIYVVNSITALRSVSKTQYTHAYVTGYYAHGDGGGGHYYYDSGDTTTSDDGGGTIVATDGGRWKLETDGKSVRLTQFGAKPDSTTTIASQIAYASAYLTNHHGGGDLYVDGSFYCNNDLQLTANVNLRGYNSAPVLQYDGSIDIAGSSAIYIGGASEIMLPSTCEISGIIFFSAHMRPSGSNPLPWSTPTSASNGIAAYSGGIFGPSAMCYVKDCAIIGYSDGAFGGYAYFENCAFDCTNGISTSGAATSLHKLKNCIISPFINASVGGTATRTGKALDLEGSGIVENCYISGFQGGAKIKANGGDFVVNNLTASNATSATASTIQQSASASTYGVKYNGCTISSSGAYFPIDVVSGTYFADGCALTSAAVNGVNLGASAGYGLIVGSKISGGGSLVGGDASALLKCVQLPQLAARVPIAFTPVVKFGGSATGVTFTTQVASYVIDGNTVTGSVYIVLSSKGAGSGAMTIEGLPYISSNTTGAYGTACIGYYTSVNAAAGSKGICARIDKNASIINLYNTSDTGATTFTYSHATDTTAIQLTFSYMIDR